MAICAYVAVAGCGFGIRLITLNHYGGHIDEPASLLAVRRVADLGYPLFPSGVIYLQGAIFSYIAAPMTWFYSETSLFDAVRLLHLCLAVAIIPLGMRLTHLLTDSLAFTVFTGVLLACDPTLVVWSVAIRPYGLLAATVLALMLLFVMLVRDGTGARFALGRVIWWFPIVMALGTFTHIGVWLTFPGLAIAALAIWGRSLLGSNRAILLGGTASLIPLAGFLLLGKLVGSGSGTGGGELGGAFVGSHLFSVQRFVESPSFRWDLWTRNFSHGAFEWLMPLLIILMSGTLLGAMIAIQAREGESSWRTSAIATLLLVHWSTIFAVAFLVTSDPEPRYLTQVLPLGYILIAVSLWSLWSLAARHNDVGKVAIRTCFVVAIMVPSLTYVGSAVSWRMDFLGGSPDYWEATAWAAEHRSGDQIVITALPPPAWFWFDESELNNVFFLAGPEGSPRSVRYIKTTAHGEPGDYWLGIAPIDSTGQLCVILEQHAGNALVIVDPGRLNASWAFGGPMATVIRGTTTEQFRGSSSVVVLSVSPTDEWTPESVTECAG